VGLGRRDRAKLGSVGLAGLSSGLDPEGCPVEASDSVLESIAGTRQGRSQRLGTKGTGDIGGETGFQNRASSWGQWIATGEFISEGTRSLHRRPDVTFKYAQEN
jgi:hypothetical protein